MMGAKPGNRENMEKDGKTVVSGRLMRKAAPTLEFHSRYTNHYVFGGSGDGFLHAHTTFLEFQRRKQFCPTQWAPTAGKYSNPEAAREKYNEACY